MLRKVIGRTLPLYSFYASHYQCASKVQQCLWLNSIHACPQRSVSVTCPLYYSQQRVQNKFDESQHDKKHDEAPQSRNETQESKSDRQQTGQEKDSNQSKAESKEDIDEDQEDRRKQKDERYRGFRKKTTTVSKELVIQSFANAQRKDQDTYLECIRMYKNSPGRKLDRTVFIAGALKYMKEFGVHQNLMVYKEILDIFPKEKMVPTNMFQTMFMHYPREQFSAVNLLEQMEDNGVIPDPDMEAQLLNIFGKHGLPCQKYWHMMYWMPKFKHLNPWPVPKPIPDDPQELARLAMIKISSIDVESKITTFDTNDIEDSVEKTWIISAMAPKQSELLRQHDKKKPIYVEGPFKIYVATKCVDYFTLRSDPPEHRVFPEFLDPDAMDKIKNPYIELKGELILPPSIHEEYDATIFANCATGTSMKDSLLSWIRFLQKSNPVLGEIPIIFTLKNYVEEDKYYLEGSSSEKVSEGSDENKQLNE